MWHVRCPHVRMIADVWCLPPPAFKWFTFCYSKKLRTAKLPWTDKRKRWFCAVICVPSAECSTRLPDKYINICHFCTCSSLTAKSPNHVPWEMVRDAPKPVVQSPPKVRSSLIRHPSTFWVHESLCDSLCRFLLKQRKNPFDSEAEDKNSHLLNGTMEGESLKHPLQCKELLWMRCNLVIFTTSRF